MSERGAMSTPPSSGSSLSVLVPGPVGLRDRWSLREALLVLGALFAAGPVVVSLIALEVIPLPDQEGSIAFWTGITLIYYGTPLAVMIFLGRYKEGGFPACVGFRASTWSWTFAGAVLALFLVTTFNAIYTTVMTALGHGPPEASLRIMEELMAGAGQGPSSMLLTILLVVVVAPIMEETIFRGVVLSGFASRIGPVRAIMATAVLFGAIHLDPWRAVPLTLLGIVLGFLAWQGRSIWPAVVAHAFVNGFAYLVSYMLSVA